MNLELITAILFYLIIGFIIYKNRASVKIVDKIFFVYKWKKGVEYIRKLAHPEWFWKIVSTISIPICLFFIIFAMHTLITSSVTMLQTPNPTPTVGILLPGFQVPGTNLRLPFWYGIISIVVLAVVHEGSHGIIASVEKIKLKTAGAGLMLFLPVAFVEPEFNSFIEANVLSRIRMLCAGSFANFVTAFLCILLIGSVITPWVSKGIEYTKVEIVDVTSGGPASLSGMTGNTIIVSFNNETITNLTTFYEELLEVAPGDNVTITTQNNSYVLATTPNPDNESIAYLGILTEQEWDFKPELKNEYSDFILNIPLILIQLLMWVGNLNFAVGVFNLFPLWITDGGKIMIDLLSIIIRKRSILALVVNLLFTFSLFLLLFNMFGPYFL